MSEPTITANYRQERATLHTYGQGSPFRTTVGVEAEITYEFGQHSEALSALDAMYADLKRQIVSTEVGHG